MKLAIISTLVFLSSYAFAQKSPNYVGNWKYIASECKSGAKPNFIYNGMKVNVSGSGTITKSTINYKLDLDIRMEKKDLERLKSYLDTYQGKVYSMPAGPERDKNKNQLERYQKLAQKAENGIKCSINTQETYAVNGDLVRTDIQSENGQSCPGWQITSETSAYSKFVLAEDILKIVPMKALSATDHTCPKGDPVILVFKKIKNS